MLCISPLRLGPGYLKTSQENKNKKQKQTAFILWACISFGLSSGINFLISNLLLATAPLPAPIRLCADFCRLYFLSKGSWNITCLVVYGRVWRRREVFLTWFQSLYSYFVTHEKYSNVVLWIKNDHLIYKYTFNIIGSILYNTIYNIKCILVKSIKTSQVVHQ